MQTKDAILYALGVADHAVAQSLDAIEDAPLTFPTPNGGCHPLWTIGHLTFIEGASHEMLGIGPNPVPHWAPLFVGGTNPVADASAYPPIAEIRATFRDLRAKTLAYLNSLDEAALDGPTRFQPPGLESHFETQGKAFLTIAMHQMLHATHFTDAARAAGRPSALTARLQEAMQTATAV
ncbi:hypothetical protein F183_A33880 [Bryobacterales bacterium F-183]|nr:hypothetical protein F183_A33880 [Bryobacterales bacterium F-183]